MALRLALSGACAWSCALALLPPAPVRAQDVYVIDTSHTIPMFEVTHMGFSQQRGSFTRTTGRIVLDRAGKRGSIDVTIATASVSTGAAQLVAKLKGEDFFDVERHPTMTYRSTELVFEGEDLAGVSGELTLLGVTRPVGLKVTAFKCGTHPFNRRPMCGAEITATLKRSEFGMKWGLPNIVGDDVRISIPIEAMRE